jgi:hypothetical protein
VAVAGRQARATDGTVTGRTDSEKRSPEWGGEREQRGEEGGRERGWLDCAPAGGEVVWRRSRRGRGRRRAVAGRRPRRARPVRALSLARQELRILRVGGWSVWACLLRWLCSARPNDQAMAIQSPVATGHPTLFGALAQPSLGTLGSCWWHTSEPGSSGKEN